MHPPHDTLPLHRTPVTFVASCECQAQGAGGAALVGAWMRSGELAWEGGRWVVVETGAAVAYKRVMTSVSSAALLGMVLEETVCICGLSTIEPDMRKEAWYIDRPAGLLTYSSNIKN